MKSIRATKYKRMLEARRGYNFGYWNKNIEERVKSAHSFLWPFIKKGKTNEVTYDLESARKVVKELRSAGCFARIIAGYEQNQQRKQTYAVLFRAKKSFLKHDEYLQFKINGVGIDYLPHPKLIGLYEASSYFIAHRFDDPNKAIKFCLEQPYYNPN